MKKILVPTDFSEQSTIALKTAAQIALKWDAEIYLLHIIDLPNVNSFNGINADIPEVILFKKLAEQRLNEYKNNEILKNIKFQVHLKLMKTFEGINQVALDNNVDIIIMGSNGASGIKEVTIGSNTEKVVRTSTIPVLVIKGKNVNHNFKNIVFASDFEQNNKNNFYKAVEFSKLFDSNLHLLYINTPTNFTTTSYITSKIKEFEVNYPNITFSIYNDYTIEKGIVNYNNTNNIDLTIINTHGRKGIAHFLNGSISEDLVNHSERPILTYKI